MSIFRVQHIDRVELIQFERLSNENQNHLTLSI